MATKKGGLQPSVEPRPGRTAVGNSNGADRDIHLIGEITFCDSVSWTAATIGLPDSLDLVTKFFNLRLSGLHAKQNGKAPDSVWWDSFDSIAFEYVLNHSCKSVDQNGTQCPKNTQL